jgi:ribosomal protein S18 acetylase RimI-like enzyme
MKVEIRRAKQSELARLQELGNELTASDTVYDPLFNPKWYSEEAGTKFLLKHIRGRNYICLVAVNGDEIIGYATGSILKLETWRPIKRAELVNLLVTKDYRNLGAGHLLISEFKSWGKSKGAERFKVIASSDNKNAIRFYQAHGFEPQLITLEAKS